MKHNLEVLNTNFENLKKEIILLKISHVYHRSVSHFLVAFEHMYFEVLLTLPM